MVIYLGEMRGCEILPVNFTPFSSYENYGTVSPHRSFKVSVYATKMISHERYHMYFTFLQHIYCGSGGQVQAHNSIP